MRLDKFYVKNATLFEERLRLVVVIPVVHLISEQLPTASLHVVSLDEIVVMRNCNSRRFDLTIIEFVDLLHWFIVSEIEGAVIMHPAIFVLISRVASIALANLLFIHEAFDTIVAFTPS